MVRHIVFWKLREEFTAPVRAEYALQALTASTETLLGIDGVLCARFGRNLAGGAYDFIFYAEFTDADALEHFREHPLHVAHRERCAPYVTGRLTGDLIE